MHTEYNKTVACSHFVHDMHGPYGVAMYTSIAVYYSKIIFFLCTSAVFYMVYIYIILVYVLSGTISGE